MGSASSLPHLVESIRHNTYPIEKGIFYIDGTNIIGFGKSKMVILNQVPVAVQHYPGSRKTASITAASDSCPNGCDYCSVPILPRFDPIAVANALISNSGKETAGIHFTDSNLRAGTTKYYKQIMQAVTDAGVHVPYYFFLEPYELTDTSFISEVFGLLNDFQIGGLFLGRETPTESVSMLIGRRHRKALKTQEMLDMEVNTISDLIRHIGDKGLKTHLSIAYMITPFETPGSEERLYAEIDNFQQLGKKEKVDISIVTNVLAPMPGTDLAINHKGKYSLAALYYMRGFGYRRWEHGFPGFGINGPAIFQKIVDLRKANGMDQDSPDGIHIKRLWAATDICKFYEIEQCMAAEELGRLNLTRVNYGSKKP
jgi:hypothetical protein